MPLFSDHIANMYYSGTPSYSSVPYSYGSSTSPFGTSYSASYLNPGGSYSNHSSLGGYSRTPLTSRWVPSSGRTYYPILSTISERGTSSPVRINSPRRIPIAKRNYASSNYIARPININTADIDVSRDKYRRKAESPTSSLPIQKASPSRDTENGPFMPRVDGKPETGIDSSPGPQRNTISRGRTVVRLYTVKRKERDSPRKPIEVQPQDVINTNNKADASSASPSGEAKETMNHSIEPVRWREKLSEDLIYKENKDKKTLGEKLVEKFIVEDKNDDNVETCVKESVPKLEGSQSLPATPLPTANAYLNRSPDRRYSMELLAEQANLLDSLIRSENLSTATLDLTKIGTSDEAKVAKFIGSIKRKATNDVHNPLKTTKSDHSLHDRFNLKKDTRENKHYSKRRSLKKSSSGGNIYRLDSITEVPKDLIHMNLPAIEESRLSTQIDSTKQKVKPKLKTKITSSVEVSAPTNSLKFKVEDITVEEKPRTPKKGITYSTIINEIPSQQQVILDEENTKITPRRSKVRYNTKKSRTLIATDSDPMSPDPEDGDFWDKIGKRETIYLVKRKQNIEESKEKNRRALFWFQEDEESEKNDELESSNNVVLKINTIQNEKNDNSEIAKNVEEKITLSENVDLNEVNKVDTDNLNAEIIPATRDITLNKIDDNVCNKIKKELTKSDSKKEQPSSRKESSKENDFQIQKENESKIPESVAGKSVSELISNDHSFALENKIDKHKQLEHAEIQSKIPTTPNESVLALDDNVCNKTKIELTKSDSRKEQPSPKKESSKENDFQIQKENESKIPESVAGKSVSELISNDHSLALENKIDKHKQLEYAEIQSKIPTTPNESVLASIQSNKTKKSSVKCNSSAESEMWLNKDSVNKIGSLINEESISPESSSNSIKMKNVNSVNKKETKTSLKISGSSEKDNSECQNELNTFKTLTASDVNNESLSTIESVSENINDAIAQSVIEDKLVSSDSQSKLKSDVELKINELNDIRDKEIEIPKRNSKSKEKDNNNNIDQSKSINSTVRSSNSTSERNKDTQIFSKTFIIEQLEKKDTPKSNSKTKENVPEQREFFTSIAQSSDDTSETNNDNQTNLDIPIVVQPGNIPNTQTEIKTSSILEKSGEIEKAENIYNNEKEEKQEDIEESNPKSVIKLPPSPRKPVIDEPALRPLIATPRPLQKKVPQIIYSSSSSDTSSEEESSDDDDDEDESNSSEGSAEFCEGENNPDGRTSTGSNDSGFDSSAPTSPASFVYIKKGGDNSIASTSTSNVSAQPTVSEMLEQQLEQSTAYGLFRKTGRFTPPARSIPRFRKYTIDDFHFLKVLGKGSFGKVLLAELRDTEYYYAVKCLKKDVVLEDDDVECTLIERKVLALGTNHPYLCHLFATFQTDSHLFFVMEYLNGGDLMFHIQQSGRFPELRARFYGAEIVSGLKFLHKRGIVYRDLKLDNILLDFDGHVRIADFGMCKLQIYLDKTADTFCGTPDYMAPEIIKGLKYNQTVDWWSFGVLLYEMLIGQSPFSGCDEDELFWSICNEMPAYPRFLSSEALTILTRLLDKDARTRLGSSECMHGDIKDQEFFHPIHWERLERRELDAPFKPRVRHPLDTQYFDRAFTGERPRLTAVEPHVLRSMDQEPFRGFSYTNPNATDR